MEVFINCLAVNNIQCSTLDVLGLGLTLRSSLTDTASRCSQELVFQWRRQGLPWLRWQGLRASGRPRESTVQWWYFESVHSGARSWDGDCCLRYFHPCFSSGKPCEENNHSQQTTIHKKQRLSVSPIKMVLLGCKSLKSKHVVCHQRQVCMVLKDAENHLNLTLNFRIEGFNVVFVTSDTMKWFRCGAEGHLIRACSKPGRRKPGIWTQWRVPGVGACSLQWSQDRFWKGPRTAAWNSLQIQIPEKIV